MLPDALLKEYADKFYGFGNWNAKIWFIGIEEAGGWREEDVQKRLHVWKQNNRELEDAPSFYPASGNGRWHGDSAVFQQSWEQLVRMLLMARGVADTDTAILDYQRNQLGSIGGETCVAELLPLPSPSIKEWRYSNWSELLWLSSRDRYYAHVLVARAGELARRIRAMSPSVVIFYGTSFFRTWSCMAGATWKQAIPEKLVTFRNGLTTFFVTKHPADPALGQERSTYFREIGNYFRLNHEALFTAGEGNLRNRRAMIPDFAGERLDWASTIGRFITNFGNLDLDVQDYLENNLPSEEFEKFKDRHFRDRVERIKAHVSQASYEPEKRQAIDEFFIRLELVRDLRNHIAHGLLRMTRADDKKTWTITLSLPRDLDGTNSPEARHLTFEELLKASTELTDLCEDFMRLFGNWVVDAEIRF